MMQNMKTILYLITQTHSIVIYENFLFFIGAASFLIWGT